MHKVSYDPQIKNHFILVPKISIIYKNVILFKKQLSQVINANLIIEVLTHVIFM